MTDNNRTFLDAIQNEYRRLVTDKQIEEWSAPRDFITSPSVDDLDEFKKPGFHAFEYTSGEEFPIAGSFRGFSIMKEDGLSGTQVAFSTVRPEIFVRTLIDDTWGKWIKIWTSKSLRVSKDNTILGIKPFLPIRPAKGDAYMLNDCSKIYPYRKEGKGVMNELYRFISYKKNNNKYLVGDDMLKATDNSGNKINLRERMLGRINLTLNKGDKIATGYIPIISLDNFIMIKGEDLKYMRIAIDTYSTNGYVNTITPVEHFQDDTRRAYHTTFSDSVKKIIIRIEALDFFKLKSIGEFGFIENMFFSTSSIYRYDPDEGWVKEAIPGNVVQVKGCDYELKRDTNGRLFRKVFTVNVPKIEYLGVDKNGTIRIKPIHSIDNLVVRLYIKKRKSRRTPYSRNRSRDVGRYVEKTKRLKNRDSEDSLSKRALIRSNELPYTDKQLYHSAFKVYPDGVIKRTNGLRLRKKDHSAKDTYADIAMCLARKVNGAFVNGEMSYFRIQDGVLRIK